MNRFGIRFSFTTFGESHGQAIGVIIDGVPANLEIDKNFIQSEVDRRKTGKNRFTTSRKEGDKIEILSGTFEGKSTGTPIAIIIFNENQRSKDYSNIKDLFRPAHADFTYFYKYGIRDYRGGGRSSARETVGRVIAGAIAKLMLNKIGIEFNSGVAYIGGIGSENWDFSNSLKSEIFSLTPQLEQQQKNLILKAKESHDSLGGTVIVRGRNIPIGLGEPIYYKLDSLIADAMMGINGVKGVEIGLGQKATETTGYNNNDQMDNKGFKSNNSGGILGGISNGEDIIIRVHFKPTPSIFLEQSTQNIYKEQVNFKLKGRHDPAIAIRGSIVAESMLAVVVADMLLLNMGRKIEDIQRYYKDDN
jgi:chorismate synthase